MCVELSRCQEIRANPPNYTSLLRLHLLLLPALLYSTEEEKKSPFSGVEKQKQYPPTSVLEEKRQTFTEELRVTQKGAESQVRRTKS